MVNVRENPDLFREHLAYLWIWAAPTRGASSPFPSSVVGSVTILMGQDVSPEDLERERIFRGLAAAMAALQRYESAEEFERYANVVAKSLEAAPFLPSWQEDAENPSPLHPSFPSISENVQTFVEVLGHFALRLRNAQRALEGEGWRFNPNTRLVEKSGAHNRPYTFLRKMAVDVVGVLHGGELKNDQATRDEVAEVLRWWFPPEDVDARKDGRIDSALRNEIRKRS